MMLKRQTLLLGTVGALALTAASPAWSQAVLEEVVVTARRVEENLQTVPIAITAFSADTIAEKDIRSFADVQYSVPGLSMCCDRTGTSFTWIRGIPGVIGYFASVPVSLTGPSLFFDLGNIQVLKGPQGTLFGLSADAGAILYEPRRPGSKFGGYAEVGVGGYHRRTANAAVDIPVVADKLLVRLAGQVHDEGGFITDITTGEKRNAEHDWGGRASVVFKPTDQIENYLMINYAERDDNGAARVFRFVNPASTAVAFTPFGPGMIAALAQQQALGPYRIAEGAPAGGIVSWTHQLNAIDTLTFELNDNLTLKNTASLQRARSFSRGVGSTDGIALPIFGGGDVRNQPPAPTLTYSEEFQVIGKLFDNKLTYQLGSFNQWVHTHLSGFVNYSTTLGSTTGAMGASSQKTNALYGQGTYDLSSLLEGLSATAGYRYSWDKRTQFSQNYSGVGAILGTPTDRSGKWHADSWTFSGSYQFDQNKMLFATVAKGYSSGGFNNPLAIPEQRQYSPESLTNLEAGIKADFDIGSMKARTNLSYFYGWYDNVQVQQTSTIATATGGQTIAVLTLNAATGHTTGIDADITLIPSDFFEIAGAFVYVKAKYDKYIDIRNGVTVDLSGTVFPYVPKIKYNIRATLHLPVDKSLGEISLTGDYAWEDIKYNTSIIGPKEWDTNEAMTSLKVTLNWKNVGGYNGLDLALYGTNLTNEIWDTGVVSVYNTALGFHSQGVLRPRTWGARVKYTFN